MKLAKSILTGTGAVVLAGMFLAQAQAQVTYTYTGNPFTTIQSLALGTKITATLTLPAPIPPSTPFQACPTGTTLTISDGVNTLTGSAFALYGCAIGTDAFGTLTQWSIGLCAAPGGMIDPICGINGDIEIATDNVQNPPIRRFSDSSGHLGWSHGKL